ncbi:MAG TPA: hypothetical protein PLV92_20440, partial [Pirellulaceae bacterium]|nr:hypothetical protein [Pirellulaceae bacterium]
MARLLGWLFGLENVTSIDQIEPSFAAPWASDDFGPFWVLLATLAALSLGGYFYIRWQQRGPRSARIALGVVRGLLLGLLIVTLADPVLRLTVTNIQPPSVYVVFDGTDSMAIRDDYPADDRKALDSATGRAADKTGQTDKSANATGGGGKSDGDKSRADQAAAGAGGGAASGAASANDATPATPSRIEYLQSL